MPMKPKPILAAVLAVSLVAAASAQDIKDHVGKPLPKFSLTDTKGKKHSNASLKGKVVLIDFWATWCGPCKAAGPTIEKLYKKYGKDGFVAIGANITDSPAKVLAYVKEHGYTFPFTPKSDQFKDDLDINGVPAFLFVDRQGRLKAVESGFSLKDSPAVFEKLVKGLLKA